MRCQLFFRNIHIDSLVNLSIQRGRKLTGLAGLILWLGNPSIFHFQGQTPLMFSRADPAYVLIRTIQTLLGHASLKTTMIYTHCVPVRTIKEPKSPLDL